MHIRDAALGDLRASDPHHIVLGGDITNFSLPHRGGADYNRLPVLPSPVSPRLHA